MNTFRDSVVQLIDLITSVIKGTEYLVLIALTPTILAPLTKKVLKHKCDILVDGDRDWDIQVKDWKFYARTAAYGSKGFGESYMDGWINIKDIEEFSYRVAKSGLMNFEKWALHHRILHYIRYDWLNLQTPQRFRVTYEPFCEKAGKFYPLFLDKTLTDPMACWKNNPKTLDEAQEDNFKNICKKLKLKPGMRILEIECSFAGLTMFMAQNYNVEVLGILDSESICQVANARCMGLPNVRIELKNWREVEGKFDGIVSSERLPYIGRHSLKAFFNKIQNLLKPDGIFVLQDICAQPGNQRTDEFFATHFVPDHYMTSIGEVIQVSSPYLQLLHFEDMSEDAIKTMRAVAGNLEKNWKSQDKQEIHGVYKPFKLFYLSSAGILNNGSYICHQTVFTPIKEFKRKLIE